MPTNHSDDSAYQDQEIEQDDLSSEKGIDYTYLRDLLKTANWEAADDETYLRMLEAVGKPEAKWLSAEDLLKFPCIDLKTIDHLWFKYSNRLFGFSVQKKIYLDCGAKLNEENFVNKIWEEFGSRLGWYAEGNWSEPSFPYRPGSFPFCVVQCDALVSGGSFSGLLALGAIDSVLTLFTCVEVCGL